MFRQTIRTQQVFLLISLLLVGNILGFSINNQRRQTVSPLFANNDSNENDEKELDPLTKASWYGVELFGKVFGSGGKNDKQDQMIIDYSGPPKTTQETLERIKLDNDRSYFLSGQVDEEIYDPDCVFSDPFVSFSGRERFVTNLANLGSFITNYSAKVLNYESDDTSSIVRTKIMVKLELNLPWKPILAWPWGVKYTIDPGTNLIVDHEESWDIEAWEGVKQIFRKPTLQI